MNSQQSPTRLDFVSIQCRNRMETKKFYIEVLGFSEGNSPDPSATVFETSEGAIFALRDPIRDFDSEETLGIGVSLWFSYVESVDDLATAMPSNGGILIRSPFDTPFGRSIVVKDPEGYLITIHEKRNI